MGRMKNVWLMALACVFVLGFAARKGAWPQPENVTAETLIGLFEGHGDVGAVLHAGSVEYDAGKRSYTISGSGENMWLATDGFQFVWKKVSGDVTLTADISFVGKGVNEHRKAVLIVR
ncbi:MAG TPA: hypothetical protein VF900_05025, partial [Candidatus Acidoferrum sp.]